MTVASSQLKAFCLDCHNPAALAPFWAAMLGYAARPPDRERLEWLASIGRTAQNDPAVALDPPDGVVGPTVWLNEVPEPKTAKNRAHIDVYVDADSIEPLVALGATVLREPDQDIDWYVMADPEGNEFCAFRRSGDWRA